MRLVNLYRRALQHPRTRGITILLTLIYLLGPVDLIPDFIPLAGMIDDVVILSIFLVEMSRWLAGLNSSDLNLDANQNKSTGRTLEVFNFRTKKDK
jgi:uncharacterized membrane protein YkvA (DUF1232 family)